MEMDMEQEAKKDALKKLIEKMMMAQADGEGSDDALTSLKEAGAQAVSKGIEEKAEEIGEEEKPPMLASSDGMDDEDEDLEEKRRFFRGDKPKPEKGTMVMVAKKTMHPVNQGAAKAMKSAFNESAAKKLARLLGK